MALGGEASSMRKQLEKRGRKRGNGGFKLIVLIMIVLGLVLLSVTLFFDNRDQENTVEESPKSKQLDETEPTKQDDAPVPSNDIHYEVEYDENGVPTPESLKRIQESEAMEQYYKDQVEEGQKQMMQQPEHDDLDGQPY